MIRGLIVEPNGEPELVELNPDLKTLQQLVGGLYQEVYPFDDTVVLLCNELGKKIQLPRNRHIPELCETLYGTFLLLGDNGAEDYVSLSDKQIEKYKVIFLLENCAN